MLVLLLPHPGFDESWENHPAHFWLVLTAASLSVGLGYAVGAAARRRRDARLFLVSLAFISAAAFLGLHALATPGVLLGKNAGFELATPFGLAVFADLQGFTSFSEQTQPARVAAMLNGYFGRLVPLVHSL